ncbi:hypothetical protein HDU96_011086 [Phlyctochytrium bullatum]|nr:hypothetical protein HDU96_011086 [Phlyctochytrium bullatum]
MEFLCGMGKRNNHRRPPSTPSSSQPDSASGSPTRSSKASSLTASPTHHHHRKVAFAEPTDAVPVDTSAIPSFAWLPNEILVSVFLRLRPLSAALRFSATCKRLLTISRDPHVVSKWLVHQHGRHLALPAAVEMIEDRATHEKQSAARAGNARKPQKGKAKATPTAGSSSVKEVPALDAEFDVALVQSLLTLEAELSRALVQRVHSLRRQWSAAHAERWLRGLGVVVTEGLRLYGGPAKLVPQASASNVWTTADDHDEEVLAWDSDSDSDGVPVHWLDHDADDVVFRHTLSWCPAQIPLDEAHDVMLPIVTTFRYTPRLAEFPATHLRRLFALGADVFEAVAARQPDGGRDPALNYVIAMTCVHRTEGEPGEWPVVLSERFAPETVFGLPQGWMLGFLDDGLTPTEAAPVQAQTEEDNASDGNGSGSSEDALDEDTPPPPTWTCHLTEDMVVEILTNAHLHRDYRSAYQLLSRLLAHDATTPTTSPKKVRLTTPFPTLLRTALRLLITQGRHLTAQALFEQFAVPLADLESAILEHLRGESGAYYPGGVAMINWAAGLRGVSEGFKRDCAFEVARGLVRPRRGAGMGGLHGRAVAALEMCFFRVAGVPWGEDTVPEELRAVPEEDGPGGGTQGTLSGWGVVNVK